MSRLGYPIFEEVLPNHENLLNSGRIIIQKSNKQRAPSMRKLKLEKLRKTMKSQQVRYEDDDKLNMAGQSTPRN
jgi:hypothetical protein|tara:strand:+ start:64 stop:285 length:222 start_codon:yes stop_codon:yes gene_type:complete